MPRLKNTKKHIAAEKKSLTEYAHDLNNLLVGIVGNAQLLEDEIDSQHHTLVQKIKECGARAAELTEQMLLRDTPVLDSKASTLLAAVETVRGAVEIDTVQSKGMVLVIDDEEVVRSISEAVLSRAGYTVLLAANGPEGIKLFEQHQKDILCVFLDLTMPYMRGNLVFARLKAIQQNVPVYLMSGYANQQAVKEFDTQQILGFIQKPFKNEDILSAVHKTEQRIPSVNRLVLSAAS